MREYKIIELSFDDSFSFDCHHQVPCFNECCRDLNQYLTPYDILRLKKNLGISSTVFLERYSQRHTGPQTGLPVVTLKPADERTRRCPFVEPSGCRVYADRPSSCRLYPLIRTASRLRGTGEITERYMLIQEAHCRGFSSQRRRTVKEWLTDQGALRYNRANDEMIALISAKNRLSVGRLSAKQAELIYTACYDIDRFRNEVFSGSKHAVLPKDLETPVSIRSDDLDMLRFGVTFAVKCISG